jgi:oxalate decarboxylase/phosphoglucose isomerase-like protein (cupin superfamily)
MRNDLRVLLAALCALACSHGPAGTSPAGMRTERATPTPLVLELDQGERRVRRTQFGFNAPFILKVDPENGGSRDLVMGYEDIPAGKSIAAHRHLVADEIIFVHAGGGDVELGDRRMSFGTGATIFIPRDTRVAVHNTGTQPLSIAFVFSKPGFEQYLRETSVAEGQPVVPMTRGELTAIRARHQWHTVYENP